MQHNPLLCCISVGQRATRQCAGDLLAAAVWQEIVVNDCFDDEMMEVNTILLRLSRVNISFSR